MRVFILVCVLCVCYAAVYIRDGGDINGISSQLQEGGDDQEPSKALLDERLLGLEFLSTDSEYVPEMQKRNKMPNEEISATPEEQEDDEYSRDLISENNFVANSDDDIPSDAVKRIGLEDTATAKSENSDADAEDDYTGEAETKEAESDTVSESGSGGDPDDTNSKRSMATEELSPDVENESGGGSESGENEDTELSQEKLEENNSGSGSGATAPQSEAETAKLQQQAINKPDTHYDSSIRKRDKIPVPSELKPVSNKRQFISRPRFVIRDGYVYMKAPPMTQKTIVTTHIPRPPMVMPYNTFLHRYRGGYTPFGGMAGHRGGHRMLYPSQQYSDDGYDVDDHNEECEHFL